MVTVYREAKTKVRRYWNKKTMFKSARLGCKVGSPSLGKTGFFGPPCSRTNIYSLRIYHSGSVIFDWWLRLSQSLSVFANTVSLSPRNADSLSLFHPIFFNVHSKQIDKRDPRMSEDTFPTSRFSRLPLSFLLSKNRESETRPARSTSASGIGREKKAFFISKAHV